MDREKGGRQKGRRVTRLQSIALKKITRVFIKLFATNFKILKRINCVFIGYSLNSFSKFTLNFKDVFKKIISRVFQIDTPKANFMRFCI